MEQKTKKQISIFVGIAYFFLICIASVYAYFNPEETYFATAFSAFAMAIPMLYYSGKWGKEVRQKHIAIQFLIMMFIPIINIGIATYRWRSNLPLYPTDPTAAFLFVWADVFLWVLTGIMFMVGIITPTKLLIKSNKFLENEVKI